VTLILICEVAWTEAGISRIDLLLDVRSSQPKGIERSWRLHHNGIISIQGLPGANYISVAKENASSINFTTEYFNMICNS
jgi:hypothetical protein